MPDDRPDKPPPPLDYYAPRAGDRPRSGFIVGCWIALIVSWAPYLCGIATAWTASRSYVPAITQAHFNATILCFAVGLVLSITSLIGFVRAVDWAGIIAAGAIVVVQASVVTCLGITTWG